LMQLKFPFIQLPYSVRFLFISLSITSGRGNKVCLLVIIRNVICEMHLGKMRFCQSIFL
jgi:hypothetical protein